MNVLGIFRGFPGLGRVVSGISLLETLRDDYNCKIKIISYLQGNKYLTLRGYTDMQDVIPMDYCSIGLLPTNEMGVHIHNTIKTFKPDVVILDGEPLIIQSLRISYPMLKIVALLNPADVDNPDNDTEAMDYFNSMYSLADLAIVHGLRKVYLTKYHYKKIISIGTILRRELLGVFNKPTPNIYCILGGGTINVSHQFEASTVHIAELCQGVARFFPDYTIHIVCSSQNIYEAINANHSYQNVILYNQVLCAENYYKNACLVITRSGRNTLSELAYMGIPTISFITGDEYRSVEQQQNLSSLNIEYVRSVSIDIGVEFLAETIQSLLSNKKQRVHFDFGNHLAIQNILNI